jgi:plastocyanin
MNPTKIKIFASTISIVLAFVGLYWVYSFKSSIFSPKSEVKSEEIKKSAPKAPATKQQPDNNAEVVASGNAEVTMKDILFTPANLVISPGTIVTWINDDSVKHIIHFETFKSDELDPGGTFEHTFKNEGTYNYYCSLNPIMKGKITVK